MPNHLHFCVAGMVKTNKGIVSMAEFDEELKKVGRRIRDYHQFTVMSPAHHDCHLSCHEPQKCREFIGAQHLVNRKAPRAETGNERV